MGAAPHTSSGPTARPFWLLVGIRSAFWLGAALAVLWTGRVGAGDRDLTAEEFRAYDGRTDLLFNTFTQWDAGWFLGIASHGYESVQASGFFPLYPLAVHVLAFFTRSLVVAGVLLSLVAAGVACVLIDRIARSFLGDAAVRDSVLYLALYPLAFVFTSVYSEGLFLALAAGAFLAALRRRPMLAGGLGALAVATRPVGLALLPALAILLWPDERSLRGFARLAPLALLPLAIVLYALYLERELGDAFAFVRAQSSPGWGREATPLGPVSGLLDSLSATWHGALRLLLHLPGAGRLEPADLVATRNVVNGFVLVGALVLTWVAWRRLGAAFGVYSLVLITIALSAPAELFPLLSFPRFVLTDFPLFLALAAVTEARPAAREAVVIGFAAVGGAAAVGFAHHIWIA